MNAIPTSSPQLDVLIVTYGIDGIRRVAQMRLPQVEGVRYIVSWQTAGALPDSFPPSLLRPDVKVYPSKTSGSGLNRKLALSHASAPLCLASDDDLYYTAAQLQVVIETFAANPAIDVASFMYQGDDKAYPDKPTPLRLPLPKGFYSTAFEVAFRRRSLLDAGVNYRPEFGVNARYGCGEDGMFLIDCIKAGLNVTFFPLLITRHDGPTTGNRPITDASVAQGEGYVIRHTYGLPGIIRLPLFAWRRWRQGRMRFCWGLQHLLKGFFAYPS